MYLFHDCSNIQFDIQSIDALNSSFSNDHSYSILYRGTYIQQFGITHDKSVYLLPEEVLFLLEIDAITVDFNHIIVDFSVWIVQQSGDSQQILEQTFIPSLICKEYYMAYRYLRVNSYRVFRSSKYASFSLFELLDGCKFLVSRQSASPSTSSSITITMKARTRQMLTDF